MPDHPFHVIGLTGLPSSGKNEAMLAIKRLAVRRGWRSEHLSFSDQIKREARRGGMADEDFTREILSRIGVEMREAEGPGVLSARLVRMIGDWPEPKPELFIVEALRHVGEEEVLRQTFGDRFTLIAIDAEPRTIARRLIARRRADESPDALRSEEHAVRLLEEEMKGKLSSLGPNVGACFDRADYRIENNGALDDLQERVAEIMAEVFGH